MKAYILLPCGVAASLSRSDQDWLTDGFASALKPYFGSVECVVCETEANEPPEIRFMGAPLHPDAGDQANETVKRILNRKLGAKIDAVRITTNYARINPHYAPSRPGKSKEELSPRLGEYDYNKLAENFCAVTPRYSFDQVILPAEVRERIEEAIGIIRVEQKVFDEWGLRSIVPVATSAIGFYGPPGTGKSMAAEAVAEQLGKKILRATYADIESKYHGEGPKMVKAIFKAAENADAVLFLDEADSLLSKRLTDVTDGSAQAINSMRSQLLISLEDFNGIVIFATNLIVNYDQAFLSRLINIPFSYPTQKEREQIFWKHLRSDTIHIPLAEDVDVAALAEHYVFCGREIRNVVKRACIAAALKNRETVSQNDFLAACDRTLAERHEILSARDHTDAIHAVIPPPATDQP